MIKTNSKFAPESHGGWKTIFFFGGWPSFRGELLVLGSVYLFMLKELMLLTKKILECW